MSSEMRPSVLRLSSETARQSAGPGERWRGVVGVAGALFALRRFSNWARSEETGFWGRVSTATGVSTEMCGGHGRAVTYDGLGLLRGVLCSHDGSLGFRGSSWSAGARGGLAAAHRPLGGCSHWARAAERARGSCAAQAHMRLRRCRQTGRQAGRPGVCDGAVVC